MEIVTYNIIKIVNLYLLSNDYLLEFIRNLLKTLDSFLLISKIVKIKINIYDCILLF